MAFLRTVPVWLWLLVGSAVLFGALYFRLNATRSELAIVTEQRDNAITRADSIAKTLRLQRQLTTDIEQVSDNAKAQADNVTAAAAVADDRARSLQQQVTDLLASRRRCDAQAASGGKAREDLAVVLADLRRSADERAGVLAAALDRSRIAGLACEAAYEAARNSKLAPQNQ